MVKHSLLTEEVQFEQRPRQGAAEQSYVDIQGESVPTERADTGGTEWEQTLRSEPSKEGRVVGANCLWAEAE